jgi:Zn-dependent protease
MALISLLEVFDIVLMSIVVGVIFEGFLRNLLVRRTYQDYYLINKSFDFQSFKLSALIVAPGIILHELAHKFIALSFGMNATFHAAYGWLTIGLLMKFLGFPFIFFVPAYVSITGSGSYLSYSLTALAGPMTNLLIFIISSLLVSKAPKRLKRKKYFFPVMILTARINLFLFIFNMLPIPGFDGFQFLYGLIKAFF